ncbi:MAG TPA: branched-chain amino acid ABC transporter permease [Candidatus Limnocylindrales bacterium]|nr:branched-chain amino acid ABC transporter permease [Candidatus Limnocylindrales bacterium]
MVGALRQTRSTLRGPAGTWLFVGIVAVLAAALLIPKISSEGGSLFLQFLVYGLANGAIYALIALGYTMVYGIIELINFAHGDVFTLGAFVSLPLLSVFGLTEGKTGIAVLGGLVLVTVLVMLITGVINMGIERVAYRPLRNAPRLAPLITAVGMSFVLEGIMYLWRGANNLHYPDLLPNLRISLGSGASISSKDVIVIVVAVVLVIVLTIFITRSKLGKAMRATAQDREAAQLMGIDINRTIAATFFIGAALAGAGGIIFGLYFNTVRFDLGFQSGLFAFTAAVFGGIGNIRGAALGGLMIGLVKAFSDGYFLSIWTDVWIFAILILVLVFRPTGLLGMQVPEK